MTFAFVAKHRHIWPLPAIAGNRLPGSGISWICEVLGVSRSGFHAWLRRPISERAAHDAKLVQAIDKSFKASDRTYGARRVWRDVLEDGLACGLHRIERLMRLNAMRARPKRRGKPKDDDERSIIADNILDRLRGGTAEPEMAGRLHLFMDRRGLALCRRGPGPVLQARRRPPLGDCLAITCRSAGSMKADRDASLVVDALMMAV